MPEIIVLEIKEKSNISKNALFSLLAWILPLGLSFVATPLILHGLGENEFGAYVLILGFISYSFAFGIGRSITKYVAEYRAANEPQKISEVISIVFIINIVISSAVILIIVFCTQWFVSDVLKIEPELQQKTVKGLYLAGLIIFVNVAGQIFGAVLQAFHRFDIFSYVQVFSNSISVAGNILIVCVGLKVEALLWWNLFSSLITTVIYYIFFKKLLPAFEFTFKIQTDLLSKVIKYNAFVIAMQVFGNLLVLFERSWIIKKYGSQELTYYIIPMTLSMLIHIFISSFVVVIFPVASELNAVGDKNTIQSLYQKSTKIILTLTAFISLTLIAGRFLILKIWVGDNFNEISARILLFHTLTFGIIASATIFWQFAEGFGYPHLTAFISFLVLAISAPLMIVFSQYYAVDSLAVARLIGALIFVPALLYAEKMIFGKIFYGFWKKIFFVLFQSIGLSYLTEYFLLKNLPPTILTLFISAIAGGIAYAGILMLNGFFENSEIEWFKNLHRRLTFR